MNARIRLASIGKVILFICALSCLSIAIATYRSMQTQSVSLDVFAQGRAKHTYFDRRGTRLNITFENRWNTTDRVALRDIPSLLKLGFIAAEDRRFYTHHGIDWRARVNALWQNLSAGRVVRGASTITEQVVKMRNERPRTLWSRWVEGFEAEALERHHAKATILAFYLNQVPYGAQRRGVVQAARYYFDRDIDTLNEKEQLALAVMVRAPRWFDPYTGAQKLEPAIHRLALHLDENALAPGLAARIRAQSLELETASHRFNTSHFLRFVQQQRARAEVVDRIHTTIDSDLQARVQAIIDTRLDRLAPFAVRNAGALVVDHARAEILAWVTAYAGRPDKTTNAIDAVLAPRQPGSTLKPLLYAAAIQRGWHAATIVDDSPVAAAVGTGLHQFRNYSGRFYGPITLREALGNSLNIPAVRTIQFVGVARFLAFLQACGIESLNAGSQRYGEGLALGNGEISLYELVGAYTCLARMGEYTPLRFDLTSQAPAASERPIRAEVASIIADILSDPSARDKEFGAYSILNFPYQTAVKTGTSSDYRDAWAIGFNYRYTVGIWMGNMDYTPMQNITGSTGPRDRITQRVPRAQQKP